MRAEFSWDAHMKFAWLPGQHTVAKATLHFLQNIRSPAGGAASSTEDRVAGDGDATGVDGTVRGVVGSAVAIPPASSFARRRCFV